MSPVAVETAGYVVLAMMHSDPDRYMQVARSIIKWISEQRNGQGGFISTQARQVIILYRGYQFQVEDDILFVNNSIVFAINTDS